MKTVIYLFTSTGNGLKLAKEVKSRIENCVIKSIPSEMKKGSWKIDGDNVGFIYPTYYGSIPDIVKNFIELADIVNGDYFFGLVSAGGNSGFSLKFLNKALNSKGKSLNFGDKITLVSNYMSGWYYEMIMPDDEELQKRLSGVKPFIENSVDRIKNRINYIVKEKAIEYHIPRIISPTRYVKDTRPWDKEFSVSDKCVKCGTCKSVCPVDNITMESNKPKFNHNCQRCMACMQFCPKKSISILGKPMNKKHYSHPDISKKELIDFNA